MEEYIWFMVADDGYSVIEFTDDFSTENNNEKLGSKCGPFVFTLLSVRAHNHFLFRSILGGLYRALVSTVDVEMVMRMPVKLSWRAH